LAIVLFSIVKKFNGPGGLEGFYRRNTVRMECFLRLPVSICWGIFLKKRKKEDIIY
jgi:hypothetical protein